MDTVTSATVSSGGSRRTALVRALGLSSLNLFLDEYKDEVTLSHKLEMLKQICAGMIALSGGGIVHRNLTIRHILVFAFDADNAEATVVKITDFGAPLTSSTSLTPRLKGTMFPSVGCRRRRYEVAASPRLQMFGPLELWRGSS